MQIEEFQKDGLTYIRETHDNGTVIEHIKPNAEQQEETKTLEEVLAEIEEKQLATQEAIATIYEDRVTNNLKTDEALAAIYEAMLEMKETGA